MADEQWCYEEGVDGDPECPTGGWLTGMPNFVTCKLCIERFGLERYTTQHFDTAEKSCYNWGCTDDCPVSAAYRRYHEREG